MLCWVRPQVVDLLFALFPRAPAAASAVGGGVGGVQEEGVLDGVALVDVLRRRQSLGARQVGAEGRRGEWRVWGGGGVGGSGGRAVGGWDGVFLGKQCGRG